MLLLAATLAASARAQAPPKGPPAAEALLRYKPKPYVPPELSPEGPLAPADAPAIRIVGPEGRDVPVLARPSRVAPLVGGLAPGARVAVTGLAIGDAGSCTRWYALGTSAYVCATHTRPAAEADGNPYLPSREDSALPWDYVMVALPESESLPLFSSREQMDAQTEPERVLLKGDTVAVEKAVRIGDESWWLAVDGRLLPTRGTFRLKEKSIWAGVAVAPSELPLGWITRARAPVYSAPSGGHVSEKLARRTRVAILEESGAGRALRLRIGDGRWVSARDVNEVRVTPRPAGPAPEPPARWIDVDVGEQTLVLYEGETPVWATLVSSGRAVKTPRGDYPVWAKVAAVTMKNPPYEDKPYFVHRVPWVLFFQAHNAIHGAYWHDEFGRAKSHGCVNVSPRDAHHVFEWATPALPDGWTGVRPTNLFESVLVHVRDSSLRRPHKQERPIGPPDREEERLKLEVAEQRRASGTPTPASPKAPGGQTTAP